MFSLNYDLCVERIATTDFTVETGFANYGPRHYWDWERFELSEGGPQSLPSLYLYKLHGSINWKRDAGKNLFCVEQTETVESDRMEVIFGRDFKLEAADPYLFYAYEFRRCTLEARLVLVIGYSFADEHINKMLSQALKRDELRRLLVVARVESEDDCDARSRQIASELGVTESQVVVATGTAKSFLQRTEAGEYLVEQFQEPPDAPF